MKNAIRKRSPWPIHNWMNTIQDLCPKIMRSISFKLAASIHYRHDPCKLPPNCRVSWGLLCSLREKGKGLEAKFMELKLRFAGFLRPGSRNLTIRLTGFSRQIFFTLSMQNGLKPQRIWNIHIHHVAFELTQRVLRPNWHVHTRRGPITVFYISSTYHTAKVHTDKTVW